MEAWYGSPARQAAVQTQLERLLFITLMRENEIYSLPEGLTRIFDRTNVLTP